MNNADLVKRARQLLSKPITTIAPETTQASHADPASVDGKVVLNPVRPNARPVFWERNDGRIYGPTTPEFLAQVGSGLKTADFWVVAAYDGHPVWIRSDRLRSRRQFETQPPLVLTVIVKEPR